MLLGSIVYQLWLVEGANDLHPFSWIFQQIFFFVFVFHLQTGHAKTAVTVQTRVVCLAGHFRSKVETGLPTQSRPLYYSSSAHGAFKCLQYASECLIVAFYDDLTTAFLPALRNLFQDLLC